MWYVSLCLDKKTVRATVCYPLWPPSGHQFMDLRRNLLVKCQYGPNTAVTALALRRQIYKL